jgi:hypothetical protein
MPESKPESKKVRAPEQRVDEMKERLEEVQEDIDSAKQKVRENLHQGTKGQRYNDDGTLQRENVDNTIVP